MPLKPIPETREALRKLARRSDGDLTAELTHKADLLEDVVPNLVGMSLELMQDGLTFTLAANRDHLVLLDAIQNAFGGPCVDAAAEGATIRSGDTERGLFDEERWAEFARAGAARGVMSTLSMPVHASGRVVGGVNLYAATPNAFAGKEQAVADILGAWAQDAVHNADLSFSTQEEARLAPGVLDDLDVLGQATGVVMAAHGVDDARASEILAGAARRAGRDQLSVAREIVRPFVGLDGPR